MLEECKKAYEDHDYSKLARLCEEILKKDENNQKALTYLMYAYCDFGQYHLVLRTADKIRRLNPKNSHPYNCEAMVHLVRGECKNALLSADEGLKIAESQNLKKTRTEALISLERFDEAYEFSNHKVFLTIISQMLLSDAGNIHRFPNTEVIFQIRSFSDIFLSDADTLSEKALLQKFLKYEGKFLKLMKTTNMHWNIRFMH